MTWNQLADVICGMPKDARRKPVYVEVIVDNQPMLYGIVAYPIELESAVCFEIADGDMVLKSTN